RAAAQAEAAGRASQARGYRARGPASGAARDGGGEGRPCGGHGDERFVQPELAEADRPGLCRDGARSTGNDARGGGGSGAAPGARGAAAVLEPRLAQDVSGAATGVSGGLAAGGTAGGSRGTGAGIARPAAVA